MISLFLQILIPFTLMGEGHL